MTELQTLLIQAQAWHDQDPDPVTRAELSELIQAKDEAALVSRFSSRLAFGTAGLRGELGAGPNRMNRVLVAQAAAGIGRYLLSKESTPSVVIGFDGRVNSDVFAKDSGEVLAGMGIRVLLLDQMGPTPLVAFATRELGMSAGIMVTASHNPPRDNGYKVYLGGSFNGSQIISPVDTDISKEIDLAASKETFASLSKSSEYEVIGDEIREKYLQSVLAVAGTVVKKSLKVVYTPLHGVGWATVEPLFARAGAESLITVDQQIQPDGSFPTVAFPNPEEPGALDLAFALATNYKADLIIANDPDADRVAIALPTDNGWQRLTGDQVGLILADEIAKTASSGTLACSIVSSSALAEVAKHYGLEFKQTLTGFKWISKVPNLIFGYEEALGYCIDPKHVADKDGISAALMLSNIARREALAGRTLWDLLAELGNRYGHFATGQISIRVTDLSVISTAMRTLRANPPKELAGKSLTFTDMALGSDAVPATDGLMFVLSDNRRVIIRPSGTEPKLKCYLQAVGESAVEAEQMLSELTESCRELLADFN
ncbi:MAG: phospho-sugar mutase [Microbacteriaceae bacterium]|nr:phospho-sugar mutase [Microbacteriaceae bacterium]